MELYLRDLRKTRKDPSIAKDFEWLTYHAAEYLKENDVVREELSTITHAEN